MTTLKAALQEAYFMELEEIPSEEILSEDEALTFSPAFERKMKKLIRRADHPIRYRIAQAAACLLLAALLSGCTVLAVSPEARAAFVGWVRELSEGWSVYHYFGEKKDSLEDIIYRPTWVPDGYEVISEYSDPWNVNIGYQKADEEFAMFSYSMYTDAMEAQVKSDGVEVKHILIGGHSADLYLDPEPGTANVLMWMNDEAGALFTISASFSGDEIIKMAESVEVLESVDTAEMTS